MPEVQAFCHSVTTWSPRALPHQGRTTVCPGTAIALALVNLANALVNGPDTFELVVAFQASWNCSYPHGSQTLGSALQIAVTSHFRPVVLG